MNGIVIASMMEAFPFINGLNLVLDKKSPFAVYKNDDCCLIISGIGKVNAALATACLILEYDVNSIFNIGAAGALTDNFTVGDIRHIDAVYEHDRPSLDGSACKKILPQVLDGHLTASLATGDVPVTSAEGRRALSSIAELVDMEGAAIVRACRRYKKDVYLFKIISDTAATNDGEIIGNIKKTSEQMFEYFHNKILKGEVQK